MRQAQGPLNGRVDVPGDKSVSHRAALFALLADGPCRAVGWLEAEDTRRSAEAVHALGGVCTLQDGNLAVVGPSAKPDVPVTLDCGNSGTTARLLLGLLAGWLPAGGAEVVLTGDASLSSRPMARVADPLRDMGADISWLAAEGRLPVAVRGAALQGRAHTLTVPSAQVKSALLLAGLFARGETIVRGGGDSRDHTELMLRDMGAVIDIDRGRDEVRVRGGAAPAAYDLRVPGDPSTAAFFQAAAALVPGSDLSVCGQSLNPTRIGALQTLRRAGVQIAVERTEGPGEPLGGVRVRASKLRAFDIGAADVPALVDEIPVLAVLATQASGCSRFTGAGELRVKESDRLELMATNLRAFGADVEELDDGLVITGPTPLRGGEPGHPLLLRTAGDHRIAMALAVAALVSKGDSVLDDDACVAVSFPGFFTALSRLIGDRE